MRHQLQFRVLTETTTGPSLGWLHSLSVPDWMAQAPCGKHDPEIFFPKASSGRGGEARMGRQSAEAKAICAECPVRIQCLEFAFEARQDHGVWGGLDEIERRQLRHRRSVRRS